MNNKYISLLALVLALGVIFFMASCKSAPVPEVTPGPAPAPVPAPSPAPVSQDVPDQAALNSLAAAKARAEDARKKTVDFESSSYLPDEWDAAEAVYVSAGQQAQGTSAGVKQAEAGYNAAADSFEDVFQRTIPLYAQDREDEVLAARNGAISAGIDSLYPEQLRAADSVALDAADKYEAGDYYAADTTAAKSLGMYQALKAGMEVLTARDGAISAGIDGLYPEELYAADLVVLDGVAQYEAEDYSAANITAAKSLGIYQALNAGMDVYHVRQEILNRNFTGYDSYNFEKADDIALAAIDSYEAGNIEEALNGAEGAKLLYNTVLRAGWVSYTAEQAVAAGKERQNALDVKADIAVRSEFEPADKLYTQAGASLKAEKYEESAGLYSQSASRFISLAQAAVEKRRIAEEAIRAAEKKMAESEETARDAELVLEGGV
jgi:hypothetical protein